jgi:hypothetical protein
MSTLEHSDDGLTVLRPTAAARNRIAILSIVILIPSLLSLLISAPQQPWRIVLAAVLLGLAIWFTVAYYKVFRFEYGQGRYRLVTMFRRQDFAVANIRAVHTFDAFRQGVYNSKELMVEGTDGRRLARLNGQLWDVGLLTVAAQDMAANGAPLIPTAELVTAAQVRAVHPRWVTWFEAHQILVAVLVGVGLLVLFTIALIIVFAVQFAAAT